MAIYDIDIGNEKYDSKILLLPRPKKILLKVLSQYINSPTETISTPTSKVQKFTSNLSQSSKGKKKMNPLLHY